MLYTKGGNLFDDLTINLPELPINGSDEAFVNSNLINDRFNIVRVLEKKGIISKNYGQKQYNMGQYYHVKFDFDKLKEFDPKGFQDYMSSCQPDQSITIDKISIDEVKMLKNKNYEFLIIQGCGGNLADWKKGFEEQFIENEIAPVGFEFSETYAFDYDGHTNIAFALNDKDINMGKLAIIRLGWKPQFGAMWLSDYFDNYLSDSELNISEDDFVSYLELQKSGEINMVLVSTGCELTGLDSNTYKNIQKNYKQLMESYPDAYEEVMHKKVEI